MGIARKFLTGLVVAALMVTSVIPVAFGADDATATTDTKAASTFKFEKQAKALYDVKLFAGTSTTEYVPNLEGSVTREQGIAMIIRLLGLEEESKKMAAADVEAALKPYSDKDDVSDWAKNYVALSVTKKLVKGTSDTTLSSGNEMTGNMFATIVLQNLGYSVDPQNDYPKAASILTEKGATYSTDDAKDFADKKLIRDDFVGMAFGSLYAKNKDSKTVLETLLAAKVLKDADKKILDDNQIVSGNPGEYKELSVAGVSKLLVKFGGPVTDTTKVEFDVKRGGVAETLTPKWNDKKTEATLEKTGKLAIAEYTVAVKIDGKDAGSKTATVTEEKLASIEVTSASIIITDKGDEDEKLSPKGYFKYVCKNQYGEDVTDSSYSDGIEWTVGPWESDDELSTKRDKGIVEITEDYDDSYMYDNRGKEISVFGYNSDENVQVRKTLTINPILGGIKDIKFTGITNEDGKKDIVQGSTDEFVLGYEAKDADGNLVDGFDVFKNTDIISFTPDPAIEGTDEKQDNSDPVMLEIKDDNGKAKIVVKASDDTEADYGKCLVTAICYSSGTSAQYEIDVKKETQVENLTLQAPSDAPAGKTIEIPYTAVDSEGKSITDYDDIIGPKDDELTTFKLKGGKSVLRSESINGDLKLYVDVDPADADETLTLTATVEDTGKISKINIKVGDAVYPKDVSATGSALLNYVTKDGEVSEKVDALTIKDNDGNVVNLKSGSTKFNSVYYYVYYTTSNPNVVSLPDAVYGDNTAIAYGNNNKIHYKGGSTTGTATITYKLVKDNDLNLGNGIEKDGLMDTLTQTVHNIAIGDVSSYKLTGDATIWAIDSTTTRANLAGWDSKKDTNDQINECDQEFKVHGYNSSGKEVAIPESIVTNIAVSDQTNFKVIGYTSGKKAANVYGIRNDDDAKSAVTATIVADGKTYNAPGEIKSSKKAPATQSLSVGLADAKTNGFGNVFQDVGGGIYEVTAEDLVGTMNNKTLAKFDSTGKSAGNEIRVEVKDQYGKVNLVPEYISATAKTQDGKAIADSIFKYDSTNNVMTVTSEIPNKAIITVTATSGGKSLTFSIRINNDLHK